MKWFDKWFLKKARWAWSVPREEDADEGPHLVMTPSRTEKPNVLIHQDMILPVN
jgi:hypothetical protein